MTTTIRAHICAWGGEFCQVSIFAKLVCQTVGGYFCISLDPQYIFEKSRKNKYIFLKKSAASDHPA
jgi:hypothetical protein